MSSDNDKFEGTNSYKSEDNNVEGASKSDKFGDSFNSGGKKGKKLESIRLYETREDMLSRCDEHNDWCVHIRDPSGLK